MSEPPEYMRIEELCGLVNKLRVSLGLRRIQAISTLYNQLRRKEVPSRIELETGRKLYHRDSAIKALTQMKIEIYHGIDRARRRNLQAANTCHLLNFARRSDVPNTNSLPPSMR